MSSLDYRTLHEDIKTVETGWRLPEGSRPMSTLSSYVTSDSEANIAGGNIRAEWIDDGEAPDFSQRFRGFRVAMFPDHKIGLVFHQLLSSIRIS